MFYPLILCDLSLVITFAGRNQGIGTRDRTETFLGNPLSGAHFLTLSDEVLYVLYPFYDPLTVV